MTNPELGERLPQYFGLNIRLLNDDVFQQIVRIYIYYRDVYPNYPEDYIYVRANAFSDVHSFRLGSRFTPHSKLTIEPDWNSAHSGVNYFDFSVNADRGSVNDAEVAECREHFKSDVDALLLATNLAIPLTI